MVPETEKIDFRPIEIPRVRRGILGLYEDRRGIDRPGRARRGRGSGLSSAHASRRSSNQPLDFVEIDRGDVDIVVVEQGTVESANNTTVRCQVEALIGTVGGARGWHVQRERSVGRAARDRARVREAPAERKGVRAARAAAVRAHASSSKTKTKKKAGRRRLLRNQAERAVVDRGSSSGSSSTSIVWFVFRQWQALRPRAHLRRVPAASSGARWRRVRLEWRRRPARPPPVRRSR